MSEGKIRSREEILAHNEKIRQEQLAQEEKKLAKKKRIRNIALIVAVLGVITLVVGILLLRQPKEAGGLDWQFAIIIVGLVITIAASFTAAGVSKKDEDSADM